MVTIQREKYYIHIPAPSRLDLHDTKVVQRAIEDAIINEVRDCITDFNETHGPPQVIRLASSDFSSLKEAIQRESGKDWISSSDLTFGGIPVKATCKSGRGPIVLDSIFDEDAEEEE